MFTQSLRITFSKMDGTQLGSVTVSPRGIDIPMQLWGILNQIFPQGVFPGLDPSDTMMHLRGLPSQLTVRGVGPLKITKSAA